MKKIAFAIALSLPFLSLAQSSDYLHQDTDHAALYWLIGAYLFACLIVAIVADHRGWEGFGVFFIGIFCTPLVAAVLYSPYKIEKAEPAQPEAAEQAIVPNPLIAARE